MSTHDERLAEIERRYFDATSHYYDDMTRASTPEQAAAVDSQYVAARDAYNEAILRRLIGNSQMIEDTLASLKAANDEVDRLRQQGEALANVLGILAQAASLATRLVLIAA